MRKPVTAILTTAILAVGTVLPAQAQSPGGPSQGADAQQAPQIDVNDSQLELFSQASDKIYEVRQGYQQKMAAAASAEEAQKVQEQSSDAIISTIESFGMTVDEFNQIAYALQADPVLRERYEELNY